MCLRHNLRGISITDSYFFALNNIRDEADRSVFMRKKRYTGNSGAVTLEEQRVLQDVLKKVPVILNIQVFLVNIIGRHIINFLYNNSVRLGNRHFPAEGTPTQIR